VRLIAITAVLLLGSCSTPDAPKTIAPAELDTVDEPTIRGRIRRVHSNQSCDTSHGYLPYILFEKKQPRVNQWHLLTGVVGVGTTTKTPKPMTAFWVVGHKLLETPLEHFAAPGCQLLVQPTTIVFAGQTAPAPNDRIGAWSKGTTAFLLIRPAPATLGHSIYVQLGVVEPGHNMAGIIASAFSVQLEIGT